MVFYFITTSWPRAYPAAARAPLSGPCLFYITSKVTCPGPAQPEFPPANARAACKVNMNVIQKTCIISQSANIYILRERRSNSNKMMTMMVIDKINASICLSITYLHTEINRALDAPSPHRHLLRRRPLMRALHIGRLNEQILVPHSILLARSSKTCLWYHLASGLSKLVILFVRISSLFSSLLLFFFFFFFFRYRIELNMCVFSLPLFLCIPPR